MILILDNFDSFTYNLVDYFNQLNVDCEVIRNDIHPEKIDISKYDALVLSPGPGRPEDAGYLLDYIKSFESNLPILGICLGHQALAKYFGGEVVQALKPMHGKLSQVRILEQNQLLEDMESSFEVVRYHSLVVNIEETLLLPLAETAEGENMIFKHCNKQIFGIQYHPEAALTRYGLKILDNWVNIMKAKSLAFVNKIA
ncbi:aminodeoxychorismate/anthranilate synthase component II [Marivirga arenosa]|uniref:Aminodeoxychorismate/anthranilate synthase component II n=1 Tax=Marivirga arenosa TaxID=3059076 RepID=A0AA51RD98_9BACT|nr:aminodeoxychorismate/anthranilate synthase component II [Marivirga sp. ABR2-2]WMN07579.1 aminodeoxychorismate/anthranilate synthase component II [Marivirga sp. ABR2-2]